MKMHVSLRKLAVFGAVFACLVLAGGAQALVLPPGSTVCVDSGSAPNWIAASGNVGAPAGAAVTFRLRNVTKSQLVAGPVVGTFTPPQLFNIPGNGDPDVYRLCANNNIVGVTVNVDLSISGH